MSQHHIKMGVSPTKRCLQMICVCLLVIVASGSAAEDSLNVFDYANRLLESKKYDEAMKAYEFFLHENPDHQLAPAAKWAIANIFYTVKQDYHKAAIVYQNLISRHGETGWEIFSFDRLGLCYEKQDEWDEAAKVYQSALERLTAPVHSELAAEWTEIFASRLVANYRRLGDLVSIVHFYENSLKRNPGGQWAPQYQFELAGVHLEMNQPLEAARVYAMVVDRYPLSVFAERVYSESAVLLAAQLDYDWKPFSVFKNSVELSQSGRFDDAQEGFDRVIESKVGTGMENAARFMKELTAFRRTGDADTLSDFLGAKRDDFPYGFGGIDEERFSSIINVITDAKRMINSDPENYDAYRRMASAYYETEAYHPAITAYMKAIELDPGNNDLYNMLGYCYLGIGAYDEAIEILSRMLESAPDDPNSYDSMAEAYFRKGDNKQAIRYYKKALSVDAEFAHPYYMLGEIYHKMKKDDLAKEYLQQYLALAPNGLRSEDALNILDKIPER